jgi:hypothetical protein
VEHRGLLKRRTHGLRILGKESRFEGAEPLKEQERTRPSTFRRYSLREQGAEQERVWRVFDELICRLQSREARARLGGTDALEFAAAGQELFGDRHARLDS